jgi:GNAT superfamily N-acetyltransferase
MGQIEIRKLDSELAPDARELILRRFTELSAPEVIETWYGDVRAMAQNYVGNERPAGFVAIDGDRVVGAAVVRARRPTIEPLADRYNPAVTCELGRVIVEPDYRRRGIARLLVEAARIWANSRYAVITLHTDVTNPTALAFWSRIATEIHETKDGIVYFELPLDQSVPAGSLATHIVTSGGTP